MFVLNHFASCHDPEIFDDPESFLPERWFRNEQGRLKHHPFAAMPFGYGKRTCLGKLFVD
jgi:cytochrome P450